MENKPFIIYKSSAGSGKTYTLTMEYLKLALKHPKSAFRQILAVTFTNKATQEMKERILKELVRLRASVNPDEKMDSELMKSLGVDEAGLQQKASETLTAILHDYGHFSVSTIDSFFQKVVRSFAREMDLNAKFEVELDQQAVLNRVVDRVVMLVMEDDFLHKWLVDYASEQIQNGKSWDIRRNIRELGSQIFQENFKRYASEIRMFLKEKENISKLQAFARERRGELLKITRELKDQANEIRIKNGLEWTDFSGASSSFAKKFDQLGDRKCPVPELSPTQVDKIDNLEKWYTKKSPLTSQIEAAYHQGLNQILKQFEPLNYQWKTLEAISKNIYVFGIFRNLLDELSAIKDEESILLISDANEFLKEITKENDAPFIYEKVGNQYRNFLIDEFQDTSGFQWASFKPLLENSLSQGHTNLLVGDVKQSIYRWRGGEMKLLLEQVEAETGIYGIQHENLDTNFRSLPNIIEFNNALFKRLPASFESSLKEGYGVEDASILSRAYHDVTQKISQKKSNSAFRGKVKLEFLAPIKDEEEGSFADQVLQKLPQMVRELQDHGYSLRDIAFLVRTKAEGEAIADVLMQEAATNQDSKYRYDVLSDESMYLHKSASVKALVAGLRYLQYPDDQVQFKTMWYYRSVLKEDPVDHSHFSIDHIPDHLREKVEAFRKIEPLLLQLPLMEALEELIRSLDLMEIGLEKAYISGFKEAVYDFTANNRSDLAGFLEWWEENQSKRTVKIPEGHDAMQIMTIHKSKGLQFKVVLMPFLKWTIFDTAKGNVIWAPFEDPEKGLSAIIPLTLGSSLAQSSFRDIYAEESILAYLDSLNMIYVALTRAEDVFWGLVPYREKIGSQNSLEVHLQMILANGSQIEQDFDLSEYFDGETRIFEFGQWPEEKPEKPELLPVPNLRWAYKNWSELLRVKKYAVDFSPEGLEQRRKRNFGLLVHEILEKSVHLEAALSHLQAFYFEGRISESEKAEVETQLNDLFSNPVFKDWFEGQGILLAEQGILLPGGKQKRPDRIILRKDESIIVDFKTGEKLEKYENQVREYMELVKKLTQKPVKGYLCYLETGKIETVHA
ncbi:UvrD-helicase domain-containing protein [Algoriphagus mannitolivorans]|uniref:UvrD-helicase domain-containing protein n=1 Tax=Algoriphagus mannitolivorans TaxID=226504 RepID=UPI00041A9BA2|nr:UvrD-helicase domain-containing protein [Algoriphagus mannitolivorans]